MPRAPPVERLPVREALRESRHAGDSPQRARQRPGSAPVGAPPVTRRGIWRGIPPFHERQNPRLRCGFRCRSCSPARNSTGNPRPRTSTTAATGCPLRGGRGQSGPGCSGAGGFGGAVRRGPEAGWAALDGPASPAWAGVSRRCRSASVCSRSFGRGDIGAPGARPRASAGRRTFRTSMCVIRCR